MRKAFILWAGVLAIAMTLPSFAGAAESLNLNTPSAKLVSKVINGQGQITQIFPAVLGLVGFVVQSKQGGNSGIVYADSKGQYVFAGSIISAKGQDLTQIYTNEYINSKIAGPAYAEANKLHFFSSGSDKAPHKMLVLIDPNCIYCHLLYKEMQPLIAEGQLQIRWLPVAFRAPSSPGMAAAMLNTHSDAASSKLLDQNEAVFDDKTEQGGLTPIEPNTQDPGVTEAFKKVAQNTDFFSKSGFQGTPTVLYKQSDGKVIMVPGYVSGKAFKAMVDNAGNSW